MSPSAPVLGGRASWSTRRRLFPCCFNMLCRHLGGKYHHMRIQHYAPLPLNSYPNEFRMRGRGGAALRVT